MIREYIETSTGEVVVEYMCDGCTFRDDTDRELTLVGAEGSELLLCRECVELGADQKTGITLYFEHFPEEDAEGNGVGSASYAEEIGALTIEPDLEMWEALKQWAKRSGFTDITSGTNLD